VAACVECTFIAEKKPYLAIAASNEQVCLVWLPVSSAP